MLYTEMATAEAVLHGDREQLIAFSETEHPVALQLGGSDPARLAEAARVGAEVGYDEINLNVGCPSDRVQSGRFGACLMAEPELVAKCVSAMTARVSIPVTVKCRIGIDDQDSEADFAHFIQVVASAGCGLFIVHARKAWLNGLSPKENRDIPPLNYDRVYRLKAANPNLTIVINGGIAGHDAAAAHLAHVDGVMLGRAAYRTPFILSDVDRLYFGEAAQAPSREEVLEALLRYTSGHVARGGRLNNVTRHILGLYHGRPGARAFRRYLSENATGNGVSVDVLSQAAELMRQRQSVPLYAAE